MGYRLGRWPGFCKLRAPDYAPRLRRVTISGLGRAAKRRTQSLETSHELTAESFQGFRLACRRIQSVGKIDKCTSHRT